MKSHEITMKTHQTIAKPCAQNAQHFSVRRGGNSTHVSLMAPAPLVTGPVSLSVGSQGCDGRRLWIWDGLKHVFFGYLVIFMGYLVID